MLEEQEIDLNLDARNKEILKLVESIHGLHEIYKELSNLVVAQGTILDRIDFNIDETSKNVQQANTNLQKVLVVVMQGRRASTEPIRTSVHLHAAGSRGGAGLAPGCEVQPLTLLIL